MEEIEKKQFDFNDAVQQLLSGKNINGKDGKTSKTIKSTSGTFELDVPRDRNGHSELEIIKKNHTNVK